MSKYMPSPRDWVAEQVELYESSGGTQGLTLRNTDLPVVIVINRGWKTGAIRKTPLMRVVDGKNYILVGSNGGAPSNPLWVYNLRADPNVTIQDETKVYTMRVREVVDPAERERLWPIALEAFPRYQLYQDNAGQSGRVIPVFLAEPIESTQRDTEIEVDK
jgi:deazaflavin-dependent oxidoreductase (nitroreductase family)